jgi:hypothetical protein
MRRLFADAAHVVLESPDFQLLIQAASPRGEAAGASATPAAREGAGVKLFFTVPSLARAGAIARALGGEMYDPPYAGPGFTVRNGSDPEGRAATHAAAGAGQAVHCGHRAFHGKRHPSSRHACPEHPVGVAHVPAMAAGGSADPGTAHGRPASDDGRSLNVATLTREFSRLLRTVRVWCAVFVAPPRGFPSGT